MSQQPVQSEALAGLRVQIDSIDQQLLSLLNQRARVADQVGEIKRAEGSPFFRPDRVAANTDANAMNTAHTTATMAASFPIISLGFGR